MNNRVAVLDLGTNTFHLLIAEYHAENLFTEIRHEYVGVKLGEGGINEGTIKPDAYRRGVDTLISFGQLIKEHGVKQVKAIATSAMRSASNGQQFMAEVEERAGIRIETISGDREAAYIYEGVKASGCMGDVNSLIVDIGGGSVEFILGNDSSILYKRSFETGAARLMALFHKTDPISNQEINELSRYLDEQLAPLFAALKNHAIYNLIGSSGAFETFAEMVERNKGKEFDLKHTPVYHFEEQALNQVIETIVKANHNERAAMQGIIPVRVDMIVVASLFTRYLTGRLNIRQLVMSAYSLKEGVIAELFDLNKLQGTQPQ
ncbi:exopolyphosphatase [Mucilaginibacter sp. CSA2-8R]|uniref:Ppx/GppA phosphatase family protein n=1 Tax=Mucilaginibacter sp. CSA2-8R TaxID=3141542 RepID=UPI00315DAFB9